MIFNDSSTYISLICNNFKLLIKILTIIQPLFFKFHVF